MKQSYQNVVDQVLEGHQPTQAQAQTWYKQYPEQATELRELLDTTRQLRGLEQIQPNGRKSFEQVLSQIKTSAVTADKFDRLLSQSQPGSVDTQTNLSTKGNWFMNRAKVYVPVAVIGLVVLAGGLVVVRGHRASQTASTTSTPGSVVANGTVANANATVLQDSTDEQTTASADDGSSQIYTASANSLQQLGDSTNANF